MDGRAPIRHGSRRAVLAVSGVLYAAVFAARLAVGEDAGVGLVFLFTIPISLLAAEFGRLAGLAAAALATALVLVWVELQSVDLSAVGFAVRALTFLGVGGLVGQFSASRTAELRRLVARFDELAHTDPLTGLPNRRAWEDGLDRDLSRARRSGTQIAVGIIDLDHFKAYNDAHGHQAGDRLLAGCAAAWRRQLRATDLIARIGGEEFAVLLFGTGHEAEAWIVLERIRTAVPLDQTCSIGAAVWQIGEPVDRLIQRADAALYQAKEAGRDRVVIEGRPVGADRLDPA